MGNKSVLNEISDDFVDEFIEVIHIVYHKMMIAKDIKAALSLSHEWSKLIVSFCEQRNVVKKIVCRLNVHSRGNIRFYHQSVISFPSKANTSDGLPVEDRIILHRFGCAALCRMIKLRQNTIKGLKGTIKVTERHKEELENELEVLFAMKMNAKSSLSSAERTFGKEKIIKVGKYQSAEKLASAAILFLAQKAVATS